MKQYLAKKYVNKIVVYDKEIPNMYKVHKQNLRNIIFNEVFINNSSSSVIEVVRYAEKLFKELLEYSKTVFFVLKYRQACIVFHRKIQMMQCYVITKII